MAMEVTGICYDEKLWFNKDKMKNMQRLRILSIRSDDSEESDGSIDYLPNNLCWFAWHCYPWKLLPQNFNPTRLVHIDLRLSLLHHLWNETKQLLSLRKLELRSSRRLKSTPDFTGMPNLECLDLSYCCSLQEVHDSLRCCRKLIELNLYGCLSLERFPYVNVESLEYLDIEKCYGLKKFPELFGIMKSELKIEMQCSGIGELPSSIILPQWAHLTELHFSYLNNLVSLPSSICKLKDLGALTVSRCSKLESLPEAIGDLERLELLDLSGMDNLVSLPSSICELKGLVRLRVSFCYKLETLPEAIGDLEKLEELDAFYTLISRPPSSIIRLNKLKSLTFAKVKSEDRANFVFPQVNEGLVSLEKLDLSCCNLMDGGLPKDIGSLSSLKELDLSGNNFELLPQSIAQLGALRSLNLSNCKKLKELPEFPPQLDTIYADWRNDWICTQLFQNISSLQHELMRYSKRVSDSLSLRVIMSRMHNIPSWFHHQGIVSINLPDNWYVSDNFLGFAVCYSGKLVDDITTQLIPSYDYGESLMSQKIAGSNYSGCINRYGLHFLLVPLAGLWDASKANGKTPNDYVCFSLYSPAGNYSCEETKFGIRLLYKDDAELRTGMRRSSKEPSCPYNKKQRSQFPRRLGL